MVRSCPSIIVSDTSVLVNFLRIDRMDLIARHSHDFVVTDGRLVLTPVTPETDVVMKAHEKTLQRYRAAFQKLSNI